MKIKWIEEGMMRKLSKKGRAVFIGILFTLLTLTLSGCFPTEKRSEPAEESGGTAVSLADSPSSGEMPQDLPAHLEKQLGKNVVVDADVTGVGVAQLSLIDVKLRQFDLAALQQAFFPEEKIVSTDTHESEVNADYTDTVYTGENGSWLNVGLGSLNYDETQAREKAYAAVLSNYDIYTEGSIESVFQKESLKSFTRQEAAERAGEKLTAIGIETLSEPRIVALDDETLQEEYDSFAMIGEKSPEPFAEGDEAYLLVYQMQYDGVRLTSSGYTDVKPNGDISACAGTRIHVLVSRGKVIAVDISGLYAVESVYPYQAQGVSLDRVLEVPDDKYNDILLSDSLLVSAIALEYVPVSTNEQLDMWQLQPYWVVTVTQTQTITDDRGSSERKTSFPLFISFDTGEEKEVGEVF